MFHASSEEGEPAPKTKKGIIERHTDRYYVNYESFMKSEPGYVPPDSSPAKIIRQIINPKDIDQRMKRIKMRITARQHFLEQMEHSASDVKKRMERYSGMSATVTDDLITLTSNLQVRGKDLPIFSMKLVLVYIPMSDKWKISRTQSDIPHVVKFFDSCGFQFLCRKGGFWQIRTIHRRAMKYFKRKHYFHLFIAKVENDYYNIKIKLDKDFQKLQLELTDEAWPPKFKRTDVHDCLKIAFQFNADHSIADTVFDFTYHHPEDPEGKLKENENLLKEILTDGHSLDLEGIFSKIMGRKLIGNRYELNDLSQFQ